MAVCSKLSTVFAFASRSSVRNHGSGIRQGYWVLCLCASSLAHHSDRTRNPDPIQWDCIAHSTLRRVEFQRIPPQEGVEFVAKARSFRFSLFNRPCRFFWRYSCISHLLESLRTVAQGQRSIRSSERCGVSRSDRALLQFK